MQKANLFKDFLAAGGVAAGGPTGIYANLLTFPAEMIMRSDWTFGGVYTFDVIDWEGAPPRWGGYITYSHEWKDYPNAHLVNQYGAQGEIQFSGDQGTWTYQNIQDSITIPKAMCGTLPVVVSFSTSWSGSGKAVLNVVDPSNPISFEPVEGVAVVTVTFKEDASYRITLRGARIMLTSGYYHTPPCVLTSSTGETKTMPDGRTFQGWNEWWLDLDGTLDASDVREISSQKIITTPAASDGAGGTVTGPTTTITWVFIREDK